MEEDKWFTPDQSPKEDGSYIGFFQERINYFDGEGPQWYSTKGIIIYKEGGWQIPGFVAGSKSFTHWTYLPANPKNGVFQKGMEEPNENFPITTPRDLSAEIMNIRIDNSKLDEAIEFALKHETVGPAYKMGHRDARHAAVELYHDFLSSDGRN